MYDEVLKFDAASRMRSNMPRLQGVYPRQDAPPTMDVTSEHAFRRPLSRAITICSA